MRVVFERNFQIRPALAKEKSEGTDSMLLNLFQCSLFPPHHKGGLDLRVSRKTGRIIISPCLSVSVVNPGSTLKNGA